MLSTSKSVSCHCISCACNLGQGLQEGRSRELRIGHPGHICAESLSVQVPCWPTPLCSSDDPSRPCRGEGALRKPAFQTIRNPTKNFGIMNLYIGIEDAQISVEGSNMYNDRGVP